MYKGANFKRKANPAVIDAKIESVFGDKTGNWHLLDRSLNFTSTLTDCVNPIYDWTEAPYFLNHPALVHVIIRISGHGSHNEDRRGESAGGCHLQYPDRVHSRRRHFYLGERKRSTNLSLIICHGRRILLICMSIYIYLVNTY